MADDLFDFSDVKPQPAPLAKAFVVDRFESEADVVERYAWHILAECEGNKSKTARVLGIDRRSVYRRLRLG